MECVEVQVRGGGCVEARAEAAETPAAAGQAGVPPTPGGWHVEIVRIEKRWNIGRESIEGVVEYFLKLYESRGQVVLFYHETWGSCRETKFIVLNADGSYLQEGEWINNSSRKNAHVRKLMPVEEFLAKYAGKELIAYVYDSPSCNKAKQFSFRVTFRVVVDG